MLREIEATVDGAGAPLQKLEHALRGPVTFIVLPLFALVNAGVPVRSITGVLDSPLVLGITGGLLLGKPVGIVGAAWLATRVRLATVPARVRWTQIVGVSILGGVGFTMSLFIAGLAFPSSATLALAKVGVLCSSLVASVLGIVLLWASTSR